MPAAEMVTEDPLALSDAAQRTGGVDYNIAKVQAARRDRQLTLRRPHTGQGNMERRVIGSRYNGEGCTRRASRRRCECRCECDSLVRRECRRQAEPADAESSAADPRRRNGHRRSAGIRQRFGQVGGLTLLHVAKGKRGWRRGQSGAGFGTTSWRQTLATGERDQSTDDEEGTDETAARWKSLQVPHSFNIRSRSRSEPAVHCDATLTLAVYSIPCGAAR
jgi:hypothetical protein